MGHLNVVGDPLDELVGLLGLEVPDVVLDLLHGDLSSPVGGDLHNDEISRTLRNLRGRVCPTVKYFPDLGSEAAIKFFESNS